MTGYVERFTPRQRIEHVLVMSVFIVLAATGLPQKFVEAGWAHTVISAMGGIETVRWFHRVAGIVFAGLTAIHVGVMVLGVLRGTTSLSIVPTRSDFTDAIVNLRFYLGLSDEQPRFDRFDFRQKFEYWSSSRPASCYCSRFRRPGCCPARSSRPRRSRTATRACWRFSS